MKKILSVVAMIAVMSSLFSGAMQQTSAGETSNSEIGFCAVSDDAIRNFRYAPVGESSSFFVKDENGERVVKDNKQQAGIYDYVLTSLYSPTGDSLSFIANKDEKDVLVKDGIQVGSAYDSITDLQYSADGLNYSFIGYNKQLSSRTLVMDGIAVYPEYNSVHSFSFSPIGDDFLFVGESDRKQVVVRNGQKISKRYDAIIDLQYGANGSSYAFIGYDSKTDTYSVVKDGHTLKNNYLFMSQLSYSQDTTAIAFVTYNTNSKQVVVAGNGTVISNPYLYIRDYGFSRRDVTVSAIDEQKYVFIQNWKQTYSGTRGFQYAQYGDQVALTKQQGFKTIFTLNNKQIGEEYSYVGDITYSPDGKSLSFVAGVKNKFILMKDGQQVGGEYKTISDVVYSNNNIDFSYVADGKLYSNNCIVALETNSTEPSESKSEPEIVENENATRDELLDRLSVAGAKIIESGAQSDILDIDKAIRGSNRSQLIKLAKDLSRLDDSIRQSARYRNVLNYLELRVLLELYK